MRRGLPRGRGRRHALVRPLVPGLARRALRASPCPRGSSPQGRRGWPSSRTARSGGCAASRGGQPDDGRPTCSRARASTTSSSPRCRSDLRARDRLRGAARLRRPLARRAALARDPPSSRARSRVRDRAARPREPDRALASWRAVRKADDKLLVRPPSARGLAARRSALKGCRAALDDGRVLEGPFTYDPKANMFKSLEAGRAALEPRAGGARGPDVRRAPPAAVRVPAGGARPRAWRRSPGRRRRRSSSRWSPAAVAAGDAELRAARARERRRARRVGSGRRAGRRGGRGARGDARSREGRGEGDGGRDPRSRPSPAGRRTCSWRWRRGAAEGRARWTSAVALVRAAVDREPQHEGATRWVRVAAAQGAAARRAAPARRVARLHRGPRATEGPRVGDGQGQPDRLGQRRGQAVGRLAALQRRSGPPARCGRARSTWSRSSAARWSCSRRSSAPARSCAASRSDASCPTRSTRSSSRSRSRGRTRRTLILHLYSNRKQYLEQSRPTGEAERDDGLESTAGHYSPSDNVTRMFFPDDEERRTSRCPASYAHELTHHWIERRRPMPAGGDSRDRSSSTPGYWVVEGFADFVRGFVFDVDAPARRPPRTRAPSTPTASRASRPSR